MNPRWYYVEYKVHISHSRYEEGGTSVRWDGTIKGIEIIKKAIARAASEPSLYVEIKVMIECLNED